MRTSAPWHGRSGYALAQGKGRVGEACARVRVCMGGRTPLCHARAAGPKLRPRWIACGSKRLLVRLLRPCLGHTAASHARCTQKREGAHANQRLTLGGRVQDIVGPLLLQIAARYVLCIVWSSVPLRPRYASKLIEPQGRTLQPKKSQLR